MNNPLKYTDPSGYIFQGPVEPEAPMVSRAGMSYNEDYNRPVYSPFGSVGFDAFGSFETAFDLGSSYRATNGKRIGSSYRYNWGTGKYEGKYGKEVDFSVALRNTVDYHGRSSIATIDFAKFFSNLKNDIDSDHFTLGLSYFDGSIHVTGKSHLLGTTSSFAALNIGNYTQYE